jgi:hypothetical protein
MRPNGSVELKINTNADLTAGLASSTAKCRQILSGKEMDSIYSQLRSQQHNNTTVRL